MKRLCDMSEAEFRKYVRDHYIFNVWSMKFELKCLDNVGTKDSLLDNVDVLK